ncbi:MAG: hypothetical protein KIS77_15435 [Saprospiraceae bacterium]|nr:hypothetical protein [Saprospiraceae bacterium]
MKNLILFFLVLVVQFGCGLPSNKLNPEEQRQLLNAIGSGNTSSVQTLINEGANLDGINDTIPIAEAVLQGDFETLKILLQAGASPFTPLKESIYGDFINYYAHPNGEKYSDIVRTKDLIKAVIGIYNNYGVTTSRIRKIVGVPSLTIEDIRAMQERYKESINVRNISVIAKKEVPWYVFYNMLACIISYERRSQDYRKHNKDMLQDELEAEVDFDIFYSIKFEPERLRILNKNGISLTKNSTLRKDFKPLEVASLYGVVESVKILKSFGIKSESAPALARMGMSFITVERLKDREAFDYSELQELVDHPVPIENYQSILEILAK